MSGIALFLGMRRGGPSAAVSSVAVLAPMSGVTDLGMRRAAQNFGASLVVSEMVDSEFYTRGDAASRIKAEGEGIACHVVQIAGCRPARLAEAARLAEGEGADAIDINMGCPAKKVVGGQAGSALMRDLDHAAALIRAVVSAVAIPVTVKMRLGWDEQSINAPELARRAESEGVSAITVHGRTRCQFYAGRADWTAVQAVSAAVSVPVIANGDCTSLAEARAMLAASGAAGVMIGRAAVGQPWLVGEIAEGLATGSDPRPASAPARRDAALEHYRTILSLFGTERGVRHARKHLAGYAVAAGAMPGSPAHAELVTSSDPGRVLGALARLFDEPPIFDEPPRLDLAA